MTECWLVYKKCDLLVLVLVHGVLPVVVVPELLGIGQDGEEDAAHAAHPQVLLQQGSAPNQGRVSALDRQWEGGCSSC